MTAKQVEKTQLDKFREAARELETDESEENFDRVLKKVAKRSGKEKPANEENSGGDDEAV
ncbi:MAG: hypothetical protein EOS23_04850 [Mesorhizobium sp.]|nr:MAG: hypothetical protein EOS23_04850 [Mesorhizobium sp.]